MQRVIKSKTKKAVTIATAKQTVPAQKVSVDRQFQSEVEQLIVAQAELDKQTAKYKAVIAAPQATVDRLTKFLLDEAKKNKTKLFYGDEDHRYVEIKSKKISDADVVMLLAYLKETKQTNLIPTCLKVLLTDAKKYLGEVILKNQKILTETTDEYARITVKS